MSGESGDIEIKSNLSEQPSLVTEIMTREKDAWRQVLGTEVEVKKPPEDVLKPEVQTNLERLGLELRYIPQIDLGTLGYLQAMGAEKFLEELEKRYPRWKRFESVGRQERIKLKEYTNLAQTFWEQVKRGSIPFPQMSGLWVAVEKRRRPTDDSDDQTPIAQLLGVKDHNRFSWNKTTQAIERKKNVLLSKVGLPISSDVRLLEALEWNLLGNREGWMRDQKSEWTNTQRRSGWQSDRITVGFDIHDDGLRERINDDYTREEVRVTPEPDRNIGFLEPSWTGHSWYAHEVVSSRVAIVLAS